MPNIDLSEDFNLSNEEMIAAITEMERERRKEISRRESKKSRRKDDELTEQLWKSFPELKEMEQMINGLMEKEPIGGPEDLVPWMQNSSVFKERNKKKWDAVKLALALFGGWLIGRLFRWKKVLASLVWIDHTFSVWILGVIPAAILFVAVVKKVVHSDVVNRLLTAYFATMAYVLGTVSLLIAGKYRLALAFSGIVRTFGVRMSLWRWEDYNREVELSRDPVNGPFYVWRWCATAFAVVTGVLRLVALLPLRTVANASTPLEKSFGLEQFKGRLVNFVIGVYVSVSQWISGMSTFNGDGLLGALKNPTELLGARLNLQYPIAFGAFGDPGCMFLVGTVVLVIYSSYLIYWATFGTDNLSQRDGRKVKTPLRGLLERLHILQRERTRDEIRRLLSTAPNYEESFRPREFWFWKEPETLFAHDGYYQKHGVPPVVPLIEEFEKAGIFERNRQKMKEFLEDPNESDVKRMYNSLANWASPADPNFSWENFTNPSGSTLLEGVQASMSKTYEDETAKAEDTELDCVLGEDEVAKIVGWSSNPNASQSSMPGSSPNRSIFQPGQLNLNEWEVEYDDGNTSDKASETSKKNEESPNKNEENGTLYV